MATLYRAKVRNTKSVYSYMKGWVAKVISVSNRTFICVIVTQDAMEHTNYKSHF
jgi:hypothetical protein